MRHLLVRLLLCVSLVSGFATPAQAEEIKVNFKADKIEHLRAEKITRLIGHVELKVRDMVIKTDLLDYNAETQSLKSTRPFEIVQTPKEGAPRTLRGSSFSYDVRLRRIEATDVYLVLPAQTAGQHVYIQGGVMTLFNDGQRAVIEEGYYTTCNHVEGQFPQHFQDVKNPEGEAFRAAHYAIEADTLDFIDNDRIIAWNGSFLTLDNKAFWFPYWYIPLKIDLPWYLAPLGLFFAPPIFAQNPVEGAHVQFSSSYQINEFHDGILYFRPMQLKGLGLGIQHDWIAAPNSLTRFFFYGIPVTGEFGSSLTEFFVPPSPGNVPTSGLITQQDLSRIDFLDGVSNWLDNKFTDHHFSVFHRQLLTPHMEVDFSFEDKDLYNVSAFQAPRNPQRNFQFKLNDSEIFALDPYTDLSVDTNLSFSQSLNNPQTVTLNPQDLTRSKRETRISENEQRTAGITAKIGQANVRVNSNWSNNFNRTQSREFQNGIATGTEQLNPFTGNENWNNTLDVNVPLDAKTTLTANLNYQSNLNNLSDAPNTNSTLLQTLQPRMQLTQNLDWGSSTLSYEDFFDLAPRPNAPANGQIKKLPELNLRFNPLFQESFPIQFESILGRYFDAASFNADSTLNEIGRSLFRLSLGSKEYDLGLGNKVSLAGSNFEQRFYQTLDAEYILTGAVTLKNNLSPYFVPSLRYERTVQDKENNNSPFVNFDPLALRDTNFLSVDLGFVNLPEFSLKLNGGYDYLNYRYQPIRASILSDIGGQFTLNAQTSYTPVNISYADFAGTQTDTEQQVVYLKDLDGKVYYHGNSGQKIEITPEDVGTFVPYGGRWGSTTLGIRWRSSPQELPLGNRATFGLDEDIPQGFELGTNLAFDFHQSKLDALNFLMRFKVGESWQWHTEVDLTASVQPTLLFRDGFTYDGLVVPFKVTVRKDLHDFILSASWDSFYQQFSFNLALLAFDYDTSKLTDNFGKLNQQINTSTNSLNGL